MLVIRIIYADSWAMPLQADGSHAAD